MSTRYPSEPTNPRVFEPQVHEALKNPVAGLFFPYKSIPSDRIKYLDDSIPSAAMEFADDSVPASAVDFTTGSVPVAAVAFTDGSVPATAIDTPPYAIARRSTTQTINNNTVTAISFDTEVIDTDGMFSPTSSVITVKTAGLYTCIGQVSWALAATATTRLATTLRAGGSVTIATDERTTSTTEGSGQNVAVTLQLAVNDTIELVVFQTNAAAGTRTVATSTFWPRLSVVRIGAA
jgi:hypothetical protein